MRAEAKLTRSLRITGVRADGYHLIDAEMVTLDLADELTFADGEGITVTGPFAAGVPTDASNLVARALLAVGRRAHVTVHKAIPNQAGLGGGSADAAAVLRWAGVTDVAVAARLGADVAFCVRGGRARVTGIGDELVPLPFEPATYTLLTPPALGCDTAAIYRRWDAMGGPTADGPNDLEPAALAEVPELAHWRDRLGDATGETPTLAGSGSTWFVPGAHDGPGLVIARTTPAA
jgi:4-diphosphocytidyl-2-C-methyl-D-erythritol kinase